jgi:hypothetical protein
MYVWQGKHKWGVQTALLPGRATGGARKSVLFQFACCSVFVTLTSNILHSVEAEHAVNIVVGEDGAVLPHCRLFDDDAIRSFSGLQDWVLLGDPASGADPPFAAEALVIDIPA